MGRALTVAVAVVAILGAVASGLVWLTGHFATTGDVTRVEAVQAEKWKAADATLQRIETKLDSVAVKIVEQGERQARLEARLSFSSAPALAP